MIPFIFNNTKKIFKSLKKIIVYIPEKKRRNAEPLRGKIPQRVFDKVFDSA